MQALIRAGHEVHGIISAWGAKVLEKETAKSFASWAAELGLKRENIYAPEDLGAPPASGSFRPDGVVVAPCSTSSIGAIASGISMNLIHRSAQAALKEGRPLVLVPRETPLSLPVLRNLCALAEAGAAILPACPAFYHAPRNIDDLVDFITGKILDRLSVAHNFDITWKGLNGSF